MAYEVPHTEPWSHEPEVGISCVEHEGPTGDLARALATRFPGMDVDFALCTYGNEQCVAVLAELARRATEDSP